MAKYTIVYQDLREDKTLPLVVRVFCPGAADRWMKAQAAKNGGTYRQALMARLYPTQVLCRIMQDIPPRGAQFRTVARVHVISVNGADIPADMVIPNLKEYELRAGFIVRDDVRAEDFELVPFFV